jgi:nitrogen fixation NifU-like protein
VTGSCGDTLALELDIEEGRILAGRFDTDGCDALKICALAMISLVKGRSVAEAGAVDAASILEKVGWLPPDHEHCVDLAAGTLQVALRDHRLDKDTEKR